MYSVGKLYGTIGVPQGTVLSCIRRCRAWSGRYLGKQRLWLFYSIRLHYTTLHEIQGKEDLGDRDAGVVSSLLESADYFCLNTFPE
jgi:hypothetical protein